MVAPLIGIWTPDGTPFSQTLPAEQIDPGRFAVMLLPDSTWQSRSPRNLPIPLITGQNQGYWQVALMTLNRTGRTAAITPWVAPISDHETQSAPPAKHDLPIPRVGDSETGVLAGSV